MVDRGDRGVPLYCLFFFASDMVGMYFGVPLFLCACHGERTHSASKKAQVVLFLRVVKSCLDMTPTRFSLQTDVEWGTLNTKSTNSPVKMDKVSDTLKKWTTSRPCPCTELALNTCTELAHKTDPVLDQVRL